MKKIKVLWITDDQKDMEETYNALYNDEGLYFTILEGWEYIKGFDLLYIDYGFLGCWSQDEKTEEEKIRVLQDFYNEGVLMAWCGGLSGINNYYSSDVFQRFPKYRFLFQIPEVRLGNKEEFAFKLLEVKNGN